MARREFTRNQKEEIVERSKNDRGEICCERCKLVLGAKPHEIDHVIAEALRPEADKKKPITIAEGQLLGLCCHRGEDGKTNKDVKAIAKAKRVYNKANGVTTRETQPITSPGFQRSAKPAKPASKWDFLPKLEPKQLFTKERT